MYNNIKRKILKVCKLSADHDLFKSSEKKRASGIYWSWKWDATIAKRGSTNLEIGFDANESSCLFYRCRRHRREGQGRRGERGASIYREIPYGWNLTIVDLYGYIAQRKNFFSAQSICPPFTLPRPPSRPPYSASACNGRGHWRVTVLMNFGSMLPESTW